MDEISHKEAMDKSKAKRAEFYENLCATLSPQEVERIQILQGVRKTLEDNQIPFWLFAEEPTGRGFDYYTQSNWCPMIFDENGNFSESGKDFVQNHSMNLFGCVFNIALNALSQMYNVPALEIKPEDVLHFIEQEARKDFMAVAEHCHFDEKEAGQ